MANNKNFNIKNGLDVGGTINTDGTLTTSGSRHTFTTQYGNIQLGPSNSDWGHINTDREKFYINKDVHVNGWVKRYTGGSTYWHPDNDGSGSGLDADTLDGIHGASFLRSDVNDSGIGFGTFTNLLGSGTSGVLVTSLGFDQSGTRSWRAQATGGNLDFSSGDGNGDLRFNGGKIWTSINDGSGSGLDADTLDGYNAEEGVVNNSIVKRDGAGAIKVGNILLDKDNAEINLKSGVGGTSGAVNWTFNTTGTNYASIKLPYGTRASTGLHIDAGYPITIDSSSSTGIKFLAGGAQRAVINSAGVNVTGNITLSGTVDGRDVAADGTKLNTIETSATADQTPAQLLTAIKGVDGSGSGLDADTLDGIQGANFLRSDTDDIMDGSLLLQGLSPANNTVATDEIRLSGYGLVGNRGTLYFTGSSGVQIGVGGIHNGDSAMTFTSALNTSLKPLTVTTNLIVGTDVGSALLQVKGGQSGDWAGRFENTHTSGFGALVITAGSTSTQKAFEVRTGTSSTALMVRGDGKVGIGNTAPTSKLTVGPNGISTLKPTMSISDTSAGGSLTIRGGSPTIFFDKTGSNAYPTILTDGGGLRINDGHLDAYGNTLFAILNDGKVGIGTTAPATKLNVLVGAGGANGIGGIRVGGTNNYQSLELGIVNGYDGMIRSYGSDLAIYAGHWQTVGTAATEDHQIKWHTSKSGSANWSTPKMYLDHNGYLGIGTSTPDSRLHVSGPTSPNDYNHAGVDEYIMRMQTSYDTAGNQQLNFVNHNGNWLDGSTGADSSFGWMWAHGTSQRAGIVYDHRSSEKFDIYSSYGEIRFRTPASVNGNLGPVGTETTMPARLTIAAGGVVTGVTGLRAPIFYDSDNTAYYTNAASNSHLNTLTTAGTIAATGSISSTPQGTLWGANNDGSGSGLDADTLDGRHYIDLYGAGIKRDFTVNGDADKFYPVVIGGANSSGLTNVQIYRSYSETAPSTWNTSTHKGGLTLDYSIRVGGWGGMTTGYHVNYHGETYSTIVAKIAFVNHTQQHCVWLRGGGATYHLQSPTTLSVTIYDNTASGWTSGSGWITYNHSNAAYIVRTNYIDGVSAANSSSASTIDEYKVTKQNQRTKIYNSAGSLLN